MTLKLKAYYDPETNSIYEGLTHDGESVIRGEDFIPHSIPNSKLKKMKLLGDIYSSIKINKRCTLVKVYVLSDTSEKLEMIQSGYVADLTEGISFLIQNFNSYFKTSIVKAVECDTEEECYNIYTMNSHYRLIVRKEDL